MADTKKEYTSNLHPKGDMDTTVYPNVKCENIIDKDTITSGYNAGKVPDSSLVQKSLDSLSENLETTKIQVDTNKTNIATLQGDVSSLKQDNQTTKTTIAGLVSSDTQNKKDIATNTQNIENLSTVTPTDINVDSEYNLILEHDGTEITSQKKLVKNRLVQIDKDLHFIININNKPNLDCLIFKNINGNGSLQINELNSNGTLSDFSGGIRMDTVNRKVVIFSRYNRKGKETRIYLPNPYGADLREIFFPEKTGVVALTSDLNAKQSTLYRHTVKISKPTDDGKTSITFTTSSVNNTPIDSIQDLTTVFGNTDLSVSGATFLISSSQWEFYNKIHVGTSINDTTVDYINKDDIGTYNFIDMFGTTGFTITDNVTAM